MKKQWIITVLVCLLIVGGGAGVLLWPRTVPLGQCSEVYKTYANNPGIKASFIKDFRINDSVTVDVTLLEAVDSNGWNTLVTDMNLGIQDSSTRSDIANGMDLITVKQVKKGVYSKPIATSSGNVDIVATSHLRKEVSIFHSKDRKEKHAIYYYNFDKSINQ